MATLASLFFSGSSSFLQVTRITTISWMSLNFDPIRPLAAELSALEFFKKSIFCCGHSSIFVFQWIFLILAGNQNKYNILDEFEFLPDPTSDCGVSCPLVFEKSIFCIVATLAPSILIGSSSFLEETRITITSWLSSNLSQIRPWTAELAALECFKNQFLVLWPLQYLRKKNKKTLSSDLLVDSQVSDRCPWATCLIPTPLCFVYI